MLVFALSWVSVATLLPFMFWCVHSAIQLVYTVSMFCPKKRIGNSNFFSSNFCHLILHILCALHQKPHAPLMTKCSFVIHCCIKSIVFCDILDAKLKILWNSFFENKNSVLQSFVTWKKSISPPKLWEVEHITPQPMKIDLLPHELSKTGQITPWSNFEKS
jgi:hypothetical protein